MYAGGEGGGAHNEGVDAVLHACGGHEAGKGAGGPGAVRGRSGELRGREGGGIG